MVWNKLKKAFGFENENSEDFGNGTSIQRLVNQNFLNKRKNLRVNYPHIGAAGLFPRVYYSEQELNIGNISLGGLLVIDDTEQFGYEVGDVINLNFVWPDLSTKARARIVGANLQKRHMQFVDFNPQAFLKISLLVKAGHLGQRFHRVRNDSGTLQADEMWLGPTGETLVFPIDGQSAELTLNKEKFQMQKGMPTLTVTTQKTATTAQLHDILTMLVNFPGLTARVKELIEGLNQEIGARPNHGADQGSSPRTGSHG